jgi:uncharacterized protein (TIGR03000 family)
LRHGRCFGNGATCRHAIDTRERLTGAWGPTIENTDVPGDERKEQQPMFHKQVSFGGTVALAGTVVFLTAGPGLAQGRGGAGTTYGGGSLSSSFANGGYYGSSRPVQPQYHPNYSNYGWTHYYNYYPHYGETRNGLPYYSYNYGYYPPTSSYGYSGSYLASAPDGSNRGAPPDSSSNGYVPSGGLPLQYPPPPIVPTPAAARPTDAAGVTVDVPANAEVWFDETKMTSTGPLREFRTPSLKLNHRYSYDVRARWTENGQQVTQTQHIEVAPGSHINVTFSPKAADSSIQH